MENENQNVISSAQLQPAPEVIVPEMPQDNSAQNLIASIAAENQQNQQARIQNVQGDPEKTKTTSEIETLMAQIAGIEGQLGQIETDLGVDALGGQMDDIQSQIDLETRALTRDVRNLRDNPNLTQGLVGRRADRAMRESAEFTADLAITQNVLARNYDRARATAQKKVEVMTAPLKAQLDAKKFVYESNNPLWTAKEKAQIESVIKQDERKYNDEKDRLNYINELGIEARKNGAPDSLVRDVLSAKTREEAIIKLGQYATDPLDRAIKNAQLSKLGSDINTSRQSTPNADDMDKDPEFKKLKGISELKFALRNYEQAVSETGAKRKGSVKGAELDALYQEVLQAYRAAKDLGALQGADLSLVDDAVKTATFEKTGFGRVINVPLLGIPTGIKRNVTENRAETSIQTALDIAEKNKQRISGVIESKNPDWVSTPYFQEITGIADKEQTSPIQIDENGNIVIEGELSDEEYWK